MRPREQSLSQGSWETQPGANRSTQATWVCYSPTSLTSDSSIILTKHILSESGATKDLTPNRPAAATNPSTTSLAGVTIDDTGANQPKGPTTEYPSTTGDTGFKAAQADIRDPESSLTANRETETARTNVDDTGALDKSENPGKVDGPGPKPIDEVAHERGGDAGAVAGRSAHGGVADVADAAGDEEGPGAKSKGEGTGEKYIKSSGLAAEGGDFDATKPGAGREADRKCSCDAPHLVLKVKTEVLN